ncbi:hypothetical protein D3C76_1702550 [compost metagenome]
MLGATRQFDAQRANMPVRAVSCHGRHPREAHISHDMGRLLTGCQIMGIDDHLIAYYLDTDLFRADDPFVTGQTL